jgi:hypothetical protein
MTFKYYISVALFLLISSFSFAQNKDFGVWYGGNISHEIFKRTEISLGICARTDQNTKHLDQFYQDLSLSYKFNKYVSVSGNYRLIFKDENYGDYFRRHRFYGDLKLAYPVSKFKLSVRSRFQTQYKQYADKPKDKLPEYYYRAKAMAFFNWPSFPLDPYISGEWFFPLNNYAVNYADQWRMAFGLQFKINKHNVIETEFLLQREYLPQYNTSGIISVSYNFDF